MHACIAVPAVPRTFHMQRFSPFDRRDNKMYIKSCVISAVDLFSKNDYVHHQPTAISYCTTHTVCSISPTSCSITISIGRPLYNYLHPLPYPDPYLVCPTDYHDSTHLPYLQALMATSPRVHLPFLDLRDQ